LDASAVGTSTCQVSASIDEILNLVAAQASFFSISVDRHIDQDLPPVAVDRRSLVGFLSLFLVQSIASLAARQDFRMLRIRACRCSPEQAPLKQESVLIDIFDNGRPVPSESRLQWTSGLPDRVALETAGMRIVAAEPSLEGNSIRLLFPAGRHGPERHEWPALDILVLDDSRDILKLVTRMLSKAGHRVRCFEDGYEAFMELSHKQYDLILLDLNMMTIDGSTFYGAVSQELPHYIQRIIIISGYAGQHQQFLNEHHLIAVNKPFSSVELLSAIRAKMPILEKSVAGLRALVLDDSPTIGKILRDMLQKRDYVVDWIGDGAVGLLRLQTTRYDLVVLDLELPGLHGVELFEAMSKTMGSLTGRVVVVTGNAERHRDVLARHSLPWLPKPIVRERFYELIDSVVNRKPVISSGPRVLLVENPVGKVSDIHEVLSKHGYQVELVTNGYQGLIKIRQGEYDLILLDLAMPEVNGRLIVRAIAQEFPERLGQFIVLSQSLTNDKEFLERHHLKGLEKPTVAEDVLALVSERLASLSSGS